MNSGSGGDAFCKIFLIWSSGRPFVQQSGTICAILVEGIKRNNSVKLFFNLDQWLRSCLLKIFLIWSYCGPIVQRSGTICAILVEGI